MAIQNNKNRRQQDSSEMGQDKEPETLDELLNFYNLGLEDKAWQRIVRALAARGFPITDEDLHRSQQ